MMKLALEWMFRPLPDTEDPETRRRVVYVMLALNFIMFLGLCFGAWELANAVSRLDRAISFEQRTCVAGNHARRQTIDRNRAIRLYLEEHGAESIVRQIKDPLLIDCDTGEEIKPR